MNRMTLIDGELLIDTFLFSQNCHMGGKKWRILIMALTTLSKYVKHKGRKMSQIIESLLTPFPQKFSVMCNKFIHYLFKMVYNIL